MFLGWALSELGDNENGMARAREGLAAYEATGAALVRPHFLALLAEALAGSGQIEKGLGLLAEAQTLVEDTKESYYEAEIYRLEGVLRIKRGDSPVTVESCYQRALAVARCQHAKTWELRTATDLARLWRDQGRNQEARDLLRSVYDWFTEGFDCPDLRDANQLLKKLAT